MNHKGFVFTCDGYCGNTIAKLEVAVSSRRTAVRKAREERWFIGTVRITSGFPKSKIRTQKRTFCPACTWMIGARV